MYSQRWLLIFIGAVTLAGSANTQIEQDAAVIADCYLAAMQRKGYRFLSKDELLHRRNQIATFTAKHLVRRLDESTRASMLEGVDRCVDRLYTQPAGKIHYGNGFGSGGEEWMYLNDRDYFLTLQYHLWVGLTRPSLSPMDVRRRDMQRQWMRQYLSNLPTRGLQEPVPREGMRSNEVRGWVMAELEKAFSDPIHLLSEPMPDNGFVKLQNRFKRFSNGLASDFHDMEVAALTSRVVSKEDPSGRYGYRYSGGLPFDDTVVSIWGNGPSLHFASNADFRGNHGGLSQSCVYDVVRCVEMRAPAGTVMETWLAREGRGELTLDGSILLAVRGAKMANLPVNSWFDADELSESQLSAAIRKDGRDQISVSRLPRMNGPHRGDRSEGEFFIVVQNRERRLAVINLYAHEFGLMFWCRPRATDPSR
jgi:hypothetical protein